MIEVLITAAVLSCIFGPLGSLVLWKRYVYFGDGISHAALLAAALSAALTMPIFYSVPLIAIAFALLVVMIKNHSDPSSSIGLVSSLMLSSAIIVFSVSSETIIPIDRMLFGDIITVTKLELLSLVIILIVTNLFILVKYRQIILVILSREIAKVQNISVPWLEAILLCMISITIVATVKIVGALMVVSLLIIPPQIARLFSSAPKGMMILSIFASLAFNILGTLLSFYLDFPIAPTIVSLSAIFYIFAYFAKRLLQ